VAGERRLGTGLKALLDRVGGNGVSEPEGISSPEVRTAVPNNKIDITKIETNPFQPRKVFDSAGLEALAQSIQTQGLLQPISVRQVGSGYQIIAGERRFRAAMSLEWSEIPAQILDKDDQQMAELALTENIQRKDLNAIEKAISFAQYLDTYGGTHDLLAKRLEIDRSTVTNLLRLLDLPQPLQDAICREQITPGHARALLKLPEWEQIEVAAKIEADGWSVRETERFVQDLLQTGEAESPKNPEQSWNLVDKDGATRPVSTQSEHVQQLEQDFRHCLGGVKVKLTQTNDNGKGKLVIAFSNHAEFEQIYAVLCGANRAVG
jgi:ParB family chromosome partitioning protein